MYQIVNYRELFCPAEVLMYLRKSQSDDPLMSTEEVLSRHETRLDEWCINHLGATVPEENKFREIISGGEEFKNRPEISKILHLIESPKYKAVALADPQRLTRGDLEQIGFAMKFFKHTATYIITPDRVYDLRDDYDWSAFETELKRGNDYLNYYKRIQKAGKNTSLNMGNFIFSQAPFGYKKIKVKEGKKEIPTLEIDEEKAEVVRMIFDMYANQGIGRTRISNILDEMGIKPVRGERWQPSSILNILENVHYIGKIKLNWRPETIVVEGGEFKRKRPDSRDTEHLFTEGRHPAIISEELFYKAAERLGKNPKNKARTKLRNPFSGILYCKNCGSTMVLQLDKNGGSAPVARLTCPNQARCKTGSSKYTEVVKLTCEILENFVEDFKVVAVNTDEIKRREQHLKRIEDLKKKITQIEGKELALWEAQSSPDPADRMPQNIFRQLRQKNLEERTETEKALAQAEATLPKAIDYQATIQTFVETIEMLQNHSADAQQKNELLKSCIKRITYAREKPIRNVNKKYNETEPQKESNDGWSNPAVTLDIQLRI